MQGDPRVITQLNKVLAQQLVAINQYFLHARMYKNWGLARLDKLAYSASIVVMCNADEIIQRVLFLEGVPNLQETLKPKIGAQVQEMLTADMQLVKQGRELILAAIAECEQAKDYMSREHLQQILDKEEEHFDVLETELSLMQQLGAQNYLQQQMSAE